MKKYLDTIMKIKLNEYFFIIGFLFILFIIILFRKIYHEQLTNPQDQDVKKLAPEQVGEKNKCNISNKKDCNKSNICSWDNNLDICKINNCKNISLSSCIAMPKCYFDKNADEYINGYGVQNGCYDISFINCNAYKQYEKCDNISKCVWDVNSNTCNTYTNKNMYIADYIKQCNKYNVNGKKPDGKPDPYCLAAECDIINNKCVPSSCIDISNEKVCSNNYNCRWDPKEKRCAKDTSSSICSMRKSTEECTKWIKCFWNVNKKNEKGQPGRCDAINPTEWKPPI